jgi:predicted dehydrogenase
MMRVQTEAFLAATIGNTVDEDLATFDDGASAVALCDAARASASSGKSEKLSDWRTG